jgi:hypothetical protein
MEGLADYISGDVVWIMGIGITFGLGLVFMYFTEKSINAFLTWSMVISCFCIEAHLLDLWVFAVLLCVNIALIGIQYSKNKAGARIAYEYIALACLVTLSFLDIIFGGEWMGFSMEGVMESTETEVAETFTVDEFWGLIFIIVIIAIIGAFMGIQIFGSGMSSRSIHLLTTAVIYVGIWGLFSMMAMDLLIDIPYFGAVIWFALTFLYAFGVIRKFTESGDN